MNEYLEAFEELQEKNTFRGQQWFGERKDLVNKYSWAVPSTEVIHYLAEFEHILEIGAGSGYWAHLINEMGGSVEATDLAPPKDAWTNVGTYRVGQLADDIYDTPVLSVWPPHTDEDRVCMAAKALRYEPSHFLYVGEPAVGCTGSKQMWDKLDRQYGLIAAIDIPSYAGLNDNFYHYVRKV